MFTDVIIYSKDRTCQLDLLLRSLKHYFINCGKIFILEDWSDDVFKSGYDKIKTINYGLNLEFRKQTRNTFYEVLKNSVYDSTTSFLLPLCDDDVFIEETNIDDISNYMDENTVGISLRYSKDLTISYHTGKIFSLPVFVDTGGYLKWKWSSYGMVDRWGYPYHAGGLIYETKFLRNMISEISFDLPNSLEGAMMAKRHAWKKEYLLAFKHSKIVNVSINRVQNDVNNRGGRDINYTPTELNTIFLSGKIIDSTDLYGMNNNCEFIEVPLKFTEDTR
jgi:hypothetical protein